ncbi:VOC family protein [Pseudonocardia sediminis]|uniref:VOC family protein n=1 Tax=Pseudonocardia sediminis TaxID=1397368 RepID=UPI003BF8D9A6
MLGPRLRGPGGGRGRRARLDRPSGDARGEGPARPGAPGADVRARAEDKTVKNRLHIDVNPTDREQADEVRRLLDLGARRADVGQGDASWVVLLDPEGNEFCVLASRRP